MRIHLHRWSHWRDVTVVVSSPLFPKAGRRRVDGQERRCERCGRRQVRALED